MNRAQEERDWLSIIARALAFLCLSNATLPDKNLTTQAQFLQRFGLSLKETAVILGTTEASLKELFRRAGLKRKTKNAKTEGTKKRFPRSKR